jgi:outer membrane protein assembly factor BamB
MSKPIKDSRSRSESRAIKVARRELAFWGLAVCEDAIFIGECDGRVLRLGRQSLEPSWSVAAQGLVPRFVQAGVLFMGGREGWWGVSVADGERLWGPASFGRCIVWGESVVALRSPGIVNPASGSIVRDLPLSEDVIGDTSLCGDVVVGTTIAGDPVSAYHLREERVLWRRGLLADVAAATGSAEPASLTCAGPDMLIAGSRNHVTCYSLLDGSLRWTTGLERSLPYYLPDVYAGRLFLLVGEGEPHRFVCIAADSGRTLFDVPQPSIRVTERPFRGVFQGDHVVYTTTRGLVVALNLESGDLAWSSRQKERLAPPQAVDDRILVPTHEGRVLVFD